jgi:dTDP-4-dehydrorhamnose reductase
MLRLMGERSEIRVVADQIGSPTWSRNLARAIWHLVDADVQPGILHWTDSGVASWYDFAVAIYEEASSLGLLDKPVIIHPIATSQYPTPARRPHYSVLDTTSLRALPGIRSEHWRTALKQMLLELKDQR